VINKNIPPWLLEVPSKRKNASLQRRIFLKWRSFKNKISQSKEHGINNLQWRRFTKKIKKDLHQLGYLPHSCTKLYLLDYVIPTKILGIRL
jgi:hypothetical protein